MTESDFNSPILERHQLDHANVVKIMLGQSASDALKASGKYHLLITAPSDATTPDHLQGRAIIHAIECTKDALDAAYRVASGTHRIVRIKHPPGESQNSGA